MPRRGTSNEPFLEPHVRGTRAAHAVRFELGLDIAPITDLWDVISKRKVDLACKDFGERGGDGLYLWNGMQGLIVVNCSKSKHPLRQRFTAAHELAHHEMHRRPDEQLVVADKDVYDEEDDLEREANAFAANLLAPDRALQQELAGQASETIDALDVVRLTRRYGLSYTAMLNRLIHAGCLRTRDRERLHAVAQEPGAIPSLAQSIGFDPRATFPVGPALPESFVLRVGELHRSDVLSDRRVAQLLRMPVRKALDAVHGLSTETSEASETDAEIDLLLRG